MTRSARFWIPMIVFQAVFGLAVFTVTRQYYLHDSDNAGANSTVTEQPSIQWQERTTQTNPAQPGSSASSQPLVQNPVGISRQADDFFANKQYSKAVELYEQLLVLNPNDVTTYNNLGITLHYLGRSAEALRRLNEGVAVDPSYQRIWLTLGFVTSQLGDNEQARTALTTAVQMGPDNNVGRSAARMLESLSVDAPPLAPSH